MNSYGDKFYIETIELNKIYKFVVQNYFIRSHLVAQIIVTSVVVCKPTAGRRSAPA